MSEQINRSDLKTEMKELLRGAQVNPRAFVALYLFLNLILTVVSSFSSGGVALPISNPLGLFVSILSRLLTQVLSVGFILYCMSVRGNERVEFLTLFDGFSFAGRVVCLAILKFLFITFWSCLFIIPGILATYRYRFAIYNLCENPEMGCMDALDLSSKQTTGYKWQLFTLDLSYIGWSIAAILPQVVWSGYLLQSSTGLGAVAPSTPVTIGIELLCGLWMVLIALFYLPAFQCTDLGYYDIAKHTSGFAPNFSKDSSGSGDDSSNPFL